MGEQCGSPDFEDSNVVRPASWGTIGISNGVVPNPMAVSICKDLLEKAECGRLQSIAVVHINQDGLYECNWSVTHQRPAYQIVGALSMLDAKIKKDVTG